MEPFSTPRLTFIQQAARCWSLISIRGHGWRIQIFIAASHRGAKAQPAGMFRRSMGVPVMGWSFVPAVSAVGMERRRPLVYS